jgi:hypothetical protein
MAKRKGSGRPKGSSVQKKAKQSANVETAILDNPSNELEIQFLEEQETGGCGLTLSDSPVPVDPEFVEEHEIGRHGFLLLYSHVNSYSSLSLFCCHEKHMPTAVV